MTRALVGLALAAVFAIASPAHAQTYQTYQQPYVSPYGGGGMSPYLNLLRGGNPAVNYYGLVVPQIQAQNQFQQLQTRVAGGSTGASSSFVGQPTNRVQVDTGHEAEFLSYGGYFNRIGSQGSYNPGTRYGQGGQPGLYGGGIGQPGMTGQAPATFGQPGTFGRR